MNNFHLNTEVLFWIKYGFQDEVTEYIWKSNMSEACSSMTKLYWAAFVTRVLVVFWTTIYIIFFIYRFKNDIVIVGDFLTVSV